MVDVVAAVEMKNHNLPSSIVSLVFIVLLDSQVHGQFFDYDYIYQSWYNPSLGFRGPGKIHLIIRKHKAQWLAILHLAQRPQVLFSAFPRYF